MKITCDRDLLNKAVNITIKAIDQKSTQTQLKCLLLKATHDRFTITGNDLKLGIESFNIEANILQPGDILIDARMLSDIVRKLPNGQVLIEVLDNNIVNISALKSEFNVIGIEADEYPPIPEVIKTKPLNINGMLFSNLIDRTIFAAAKEEIKPILTGELIECDGNNLNVVAIDGFRVAHGKHTFDEPKEPLKVVVPSRSLNEISKIVGELDEDIIIYKTEQLFIVESKNGIIITRLLNGEYMEYNKTFTDTCTTKIVLDKSEFLNSIERSVLVAREGKKTPVKFSITDNKMSLSSNTDRGKSFDEIDGETDGEDLEIAFNPNFILDVLKNIEDDKICINFTTPLSPCIIKDNSEQNFRYLVLPLRLKG